MNVAQLAQWWNEAQEAASPDKAARAVLDYVNEHGEANLDELRELLTDQGVEPELHLWILASLVDQHYLRDSDGDAYYPGSAMPAKQAEKFEDGEYHGPTPPGPGWVQSGVGAHGGKIWKRKEDGDKGADDEGSNKNGLLSHVTGKVGDGVKKAVGAALEAIDGELRGGGSLIMQGLRNMSPSMVMYGISRAVTSAYGMGAGSMGSAEDTMEEVFEAAMAQHSVGGAHAIGVIASKALVAGERLLISGIKKLLGKLGFGAGESKLSEDMQELPPEALEFFTRIARQSALTIKASILDAMGIEVKEATEHAEGEYHGPEAPGEGWKQVGVGPMGGKIWRKADTGSEQASKPEQSQDAPQSNSRQKYEAEKKRIEDEHGAAMDKHNTSHEAWEQRNETRAEKTQKLNETDFVVEASSAVEDKRAEALPSWDAEGSPVSEHNTPESRKEYQDAAAALAKQTPDGWREAFGEKGKLQAALTEIGATDKEKAKVLALAEKAIPALEKAGAKYEAAVAKQMDHAAKADAMGDQPEEPVEPEPPDEPDEDALPEEKAAYAEKQAEYEKAYPKWEKDHDRWEKEDAKWEAQSEAITDRDQELFDKADELHGAINEVWDEHKDKLSEAVQNIVDRVQEGVEAEDEADPEPEEPEAPDLPDEPEEEEPDEPPEPDEDEETQKHDEEGQAVAEPFRETSWGHWLSERHRAAP